MTSLIFRVLREDVTPSSQSSFGFIRRHYSGEDTEDSGVCFPTSRRSTTGTTAENLNGLGDSRNLNFKFELESLQIPTNHVPTPTPLELYWHTVTPWSKTSTVFFMQTIVPLLLRPTETHGFLVIVA